uniref:Uncharacterized protein n=1 Tax=Fagus sylvatica TaxID=28930 RepID=A0A2N9FZ46_FAGSY
MAPRSRVHRGVFGPFEGSFPIRIPADPDKFLAIREFHVVHGCVLLSNVPGLADQLVASQEDSVRKRGNVGEKIPELSAKPYFVGLFSRAWPCTEASLGSRRYDPANGGRRNVPYAKGGGQFDPVFGLVNGPVKPWSNLVNLGQTWSRSNLVKPWEMVKPRQTSEMCPSFWEYLSPAALLPPPDSLSGLFIITERHTVTWGPAVWKPWTHCALFDGVPLPGVWGCTGYYPSLALRQFGGVQYPPRLGDLDAVTFDYIPSEDMWRLLSRVEVIWEGRLSEVVLIEDGSPGDSSVASDFVEWREGVDSLFHSQAYCTAGHITFFGVSLSSGISLHWAAEREASAARVESLRSTLHHNSVAVANLRPRLRWLREGNALVDPATGRPQDIVALRRALDASEEALTSARTSMGVMRVQISVLQGDNGGLCRLSWTWCMMLLSPMLLGSIRRVSLWSLLFHPD